MKKNKLSVFLLVIIVTILAGVVFQGVAMFRSGLAYDFGFGYWGPLARDGVWHEALVRQILNGFPPQNPGLAMMRLSNYHYFYDLLIAVISWVLRIDPRVIIYLVSPMVFSVLLGIGTYHLAKRLFNDKLTTFLAVFFVYFSSSFGWILDAFRGREIGGESHFWANQAVSMNLNPPFAISLVIVIFILLLIDRYLKKNKKIDALLTILLSGILIGFKIYAAAIILGGLFLLALKRYLFNNDLKFAGIFFLSLVICLLVYLPSADLSKGFVELSPLWLINSMIDLTDRVGFLRLSSLRVNYQSQKLWLGFLLAELVGLAVFIVGNLGTRIVAIFGLKRSFRKSDLHLLILFVSFASLLPPLVFVQKGNPWNIVQFFYYFLFFASLYAAHGLARICNFLHGIRAKVFLFTVLVITPISSVATFRGWLYPTPAAYLPKSEFEALTFLSKQENGVVLKHPFNQFARLNYHDPYPLFVYADNTYVSAYSGKSVFIEDVEQQIILGTDYQERLSEVENFFREKDLNKSDDFLKRNKIKYLYLPKVYSLPRSEQEYKMRKIFENGAVKIYKVLD